VLEHATMAYRRYVALPPNADRLLLADVKAVRGQVAGASLGPAQLGNGANELSTDVSTRK